MSVSLLSWRPEQFVPMASLAQHSVPLRILGLSAIAVGIGCLGILELWPPQKRHTRLGIAVALLMVAVVLGVILYNLPVVQSV